MNRSSTVANENYSLLVTIEIMFALLGSYAVAKILWR
jgi:hypothetical protein